MTCRIVTGRRVIRGAIGLLVVLAGFGCRRSRGHGAPRAQLRAVDAAQPDGGAPRQFARFDATLRELGLGRDLGGGAAALRTSACTDDTMTVTTATGIVQLKFGGCMRCELTPGSPLVLANVDEGRLEGYARALRETPAKFLSAAGIERVALCWRLVMEPRGDAGAGAYEGALIGGTVDYVRGEILLSLEPLEGLTGDEIVHHELFHVLDMISDPMRMVRDPAWLRLNPPGFSYLHRDAEAAIPGFLSPHAMANLREDHATIYQYAMARPDELCAAGALVLGKARLTRDRIAAVLGDARYLEQRAPCLAAPAR